jgi:DNA-directed RNA polymerase specialized sigma24 family protein
MRVYFFKTPNRAFAEAQWEYINTLHSSGYFSIRCMVPGKRKAFVRCRDTNKCSACPYGRTPETKQIPVVSWDGLLDTGWEPAPAESVEHQVMARLEYQAIRALMDAEDPRIAIAFEAKELYGDSVKKIAADLGVSEPRVYQLLNRAKAIGRQFREDNDNE